MLFPGRYDSGSLCFIKKMVLIGFYFSFQSACVHYRGNLALPAAKELYYSEQQGLKGQLYLDEKAIGKKNGRLVILVHGGGWSSRDLSDMENIAESLATHGFIVFNIDYRLAPQFRHPSAAKDVLKATQFIQKYLNKKGVKELKTAVWGYSSGAHTASLFALKLAPEAGVIIDVVVAGGGPYDLSFYPESPYIKNYLGFFRKGKVEAYDEASPIRYVSPSSPKFFLYHAREDQLVEWVQMTAFEAELERKKVFSESYLIPFWVTKQLLPLRESRLSVVLIF